MAVTVDVLVRRVLAAHEALAGVAGPIEDEWQYVADLGTVWRARLEHVRAARGTEPVTPAVEAAIDRLAEEAALVVDPHRAIDWLSTLPQVALLALGEAA